MSGPFLPFLASLALLVQMPLVEEPDDGGSLLPSFPRCGHHLHLGREAYVRQHASILGWCGHHLRLGREAYGRQHASLWGCRSLQDLLRMVRYVIMAQQKDETDREQIGPPSLGCHNLQVRGVRPMGRCFSLGREVV